MKTNSKLYTKLVTVCLWVLSLGISACGSDDDNDVLPVPVIEIEEANMEGNELCVEADIVAQGRIASIIINISDATGNSVKVSYPVTENKYIGVLNVDGFHVHVPITGKHVEEGDLLKLTVTDAMGRSTTAQKSITEEEEKDDEHDFN